MSIYTEFQSHVLLFIIVRNTKSPKQHFESTCTHCIVLFCVAYASHTTTGSDWVDKKNKNSNQQQWFLHCVVKSHTSRMLLLLFERFDYGVDAAACCVSFNVFIRVNAHSISSVCVIISYIAISSLNNCVWASVCHGTSNSVDALISVLIRKS